MFLCSATVPGLNRVAFVCPALPATQVHEWGSWCKRFGGRLLPGSLAAVRLCSFASVLACPGDLDEKTASIPCGLRRRFRLRTRLLGHIEGCLPWPIWVSSAYTDQKPVPVGRLKERLADAKLAVCGICLATASSSGSDDGTGVPLVTSIVPDPDPVSWWDLARFATCRVRARYSVPDFFESATRLQGRPTWPLCRGLPARVSQCRNFLRVQDRVSGRQHRTRPPYAGVPVRPRAPLLRTRR